MGVYPGKRPLKHGNEGVYVLLSLKAMALGELASGNGEDREEVLGLNPKYTSI